MSTFLRFPSEYPYARRGFDKFGQPWVHPQNRSITSGMVLNFERVMFSPENQAYLQQRILNEINGAISTDSLLRVMDQAAGWYKWRYSEPGYGPSTPKELQDALTMMNDRVMIQVARLYRAQRAETSRWLALKHQPSGTYQERESFENDYDRSIEINRN